MKNIALIFTLAITTFGYSQTKLISHKSHSGSRSTFKQSVSKNLFNIGESNFGMAPQRMIRNSKLDSVILISKNVAIMVTSESCHFEEYDGRDKSSAQLWSAGKDTVINHPVFTSENTLIEVKKILKEDYFFANPIESVVFVGFDKEFPDDNEPIAKANPIQREKIAPDRINEDNVNPEPKRRSLFSVIVLSIISFLFRGSL